MAGNIWITSDTHFFHKNIAGPAVSDWKTGYRNFDSIQEMNETFYDNINYLVHENDTLVHIGDWSFGGIDKIPISRRRIKCKNIILIYGNHDRNIKRNQDLQKLFSRCYESNTTKLANRRFYLHHYSHKTYEDPGAVIHLYGHSHGTLQDDPTSLSMDVGMDTCLFGHKKYTPYHIDEIVHIMDTYKSFVPKDHHKE